MAKSTLEDWARTHEAVLRSVTQHSGDAFMVLDLDAKIRFINWTLPGLSVEQVLGTQVFAYVPEEQHAEMQACFQAVRETGQPARYQNVYTQENGERLMWESRVGPVVQQSAVVGFVVISSDVTERRAAAVERDRFFELTVDLLCVAGFDGYFRRVSPSFYRALGYGPEDLLKKPFIEFVHPSDREATLVEAAKLEHGQDVIDFVNRYRHANGTYRTLSWRAASDQQARLIHAVVRDVTEQDTLERQLRESQKMDAVGQLAGGVAHDFNNLAMAIMANTDFALRDAGDNAPVRHYLEQVDKAARRAADLVKQLLAFSRRSATQTRPIPVNGLISDLTEMLRRLIPENIELNFYPAEHSLQVAADPAQVEQVLVNLCVNARDAMPDGGRLTLRTELSTVNESLTSLHPWVSPGTYARITVSDTGVGMSPEIRERIFEPFYSTKAPGKGTGLGLATAYAIVKAHGGMLQVQSEPKLGTTFCVYLPLATEAAATAQTPRQEVPGGGHETLLIAEDDELVRQAVSGILEAAGYRVVAAVDGADAVAKLQDTPEVFSLALLDVIMPELSGPQAYEEIKRLRPELPVIFSSGYSDEAQPGSSLPEAVKLLEKPYRSNVLLSAIREALDGSRQTSASE